MASAICACASASSWTSAAVICSVDYRNWRRRVFQPAAAAAGLAKLERTVTRAGGRRLQQVTSVTYQGPRPYDVRHSFVSLLIHEGLSVAEVAAQAGHSVEECLRTYIHVFEEFEPGKRITAEDAIRSARIPVSYPNHLEAQGT
jgi:integrase